MRRTGKAIGTLAAATSLVLASSGLAFADNLIADGDILTARAQDVNLTALEACSTADGVSATSRSVPLSVVRNGNVEGNNNTYKPGTTVTFTNLTNSAPAVLTPNLPADSTLTVPTGWLTIGNNEALTLPTTVTVARGTAGEAFTGTLSYRASGTNTNNTSVTRDDSISLSGAYVDGASATTVDCVVPTTSITVPANNGEYTTGESATVDYSCDDIAAEGNSAAPVSGLAATNGCVGAYTDSDPNTDDVPVADGDALDTSAAGTYTIAVTATDAVGNTSSRSHSYTVTDPASCEWSDVLAPMNKTLPASGYKKGKGVVPVKFNWLCGENSTIEKIDVPAATYSLQRDGSSAMTTSELESATSGNANTGNLFRFDSASGNFIYNQSTNLTAGTYTATITGGGDSATVQFTVS